MHFFVHIPKTAGTSFRTAAERFFSSERVAYDYGADSSVTSACIQRFLYAGELEDRHGLYRYWKQSGMALVAGHQSVHRYLDLVGLTRVLTFVREPLERSFSEYLHFRREKRYEGSFRDFFERQPVNHQTRMLGKIPMQALGFVGVTERYGDSLKLLNDHFGWRIPQRRVNRARLLDPRPSSISIEDREAFYQQNGGDVALYRSAVAGLDQRLQLCRQGLPFVHGGIDKVESGKISGWAWWAGGCDEPVGIEICSGKQVVQQVLADRPHKAMKRRGAPRDGQVRFTAALGPEVLNHLECRVVQTGQVLIGRYLPDNRTE